MHQVYYEICSKIEGKEKFLVFKLDDLLKPSSCHKAMVVIPKGFVVMPHK
jgi:hypothetical protein